jgi:hypothetical protein
MPKRDPWSRNGAPDRTSRSHLKSVVIAQASVAAVVFLGGTLGSSPVLWWLSVVILWTAYLWHAWALWSSDSIYPRFLNLWPALFARLTTTRRAGRPRFFPGIAVGSALAPLLGSSVWFVYQWVGWKCGMDTDPYSEIPVNRPYLPSIVQLFVIGYYWWTVHKRFKLLSVESRGSASGSE